MPAAHVSILDADGLTRLPPATDEGESRARRYVGALVASGPRFYADNADAAARALVVDDRVLPLLVVRKGGGNADVCSPSVHYLAYTLEEFEKRHPHYPHALPATLMLPLRLVLGLGHIDSVVFVNNWLLTTNPKHGLGAAQIATVTALLTATYPDAAIVFRSINPRTDPEGLARLQENGYQLVRSRRVYVLDPTDGRYRRKECFRTDHRLLVSGPYRVAGDATVLSAHVRRLTSLYRDLYLHKHSWHNVHFNEQFFGLTLRDGLLTYRALVLDGVVDAFVCYFIAGGIMIAPAIGYDRTRPIRTGLYRQIVALLITEAAERGVLLNLSAGAGRFKALRGALPVDEFDAVYARHLRPHRRFAWTSLRLTSALWARTRGADGPGPRDPSATRYWERSWASLWKPHAANPWFEYQAAACASWVRARAAGAVPCGAAVVLKTDAFDEACGFDPLRTVVGPRPAILMDIAPNILSAARSAGRNGLGCATDARALAFHSASFDLVFSPSTLDHFQNEREIDLALRELRRVLRPGAHLLLTLDNPANPLLRLRDLLIRLTGPIGGLIPFPAGRTLSRAGLMAALARNGFEVLETAYVVHAPRVVGLWLGEWAARTGPGRPAAWLATWLHAVDSLLARLPTRRWTAHFIIADARRAPRPVRPTGATVP